MFIRVRLIHGPASIKGAIKMKIGDGRTELTQLFACRRDDGSVLSHIYVGSARADGMRYVLRVNVWCDCVWQMT